MLHNVLSFALRNVTRIVASLALGVVAPTFADQAFAQAAVQTRAASCAGFDFHPIDDRTTYRWTDRVLWRQNNLGDGWFMCAAHLPHRAVVKQVIFTLKDSSDFIELAYCALIRTPLTVAGAIQPLAVVPSTGLHDMPGIVRRSDTSIAFATIDNFNFAYSLQCQIYFDPVVISAGGGTGIIGASVIYTISAANG